MFTLFKWLLWFCTPFAWVLVGLIVWGLWLFCHRNWRLAVFVWVADVALCIGCLPATSSWLGMTLEGKYPPISISSVPKVDAIVVLGGGVGAVEPQVPYPECFGASDRVFMAARLYHAGKGKIVIPSGEGVARAEKPLLEICHVPAAAIVCEPFARDTAENASRTFELLKRLGCKRAIIVTSAWHLPRAMMLFQSSEIEFIPVGCDYEATLTAAIAHKSNIWQKLPRIGTMFQSGIYLKEWLGILFYSFRKVPLDVPHIRRESTKK